MLNSQQKAALRSQRATKHLLLTVVFSEADLFTSPHPAVNPRSVRAATTFADPIERSTGAAFLFAPTLLEFPEITHAFSPAERRAPVASVQVPLSHDADFPIDAIGPSSPPAVWARLDLWCPGLLLDDAMPLLAGPVTAAPQKSRRAGVTLTVEDGDTQRSVDFPPGQLTIELADFPDAPDLVIGQARRQVIFGPFPYPIPCIPISRDGRRWYLCEPPALVPPSGFQVGGAEVGHADRPVINIGRLASDPTRTFTELVFPASVTSIGLFGSVTASGGVGLPVDSAPITLLQDIGGYRLSGRARRDLMRVAKAFDFSVLLNRQSSVLAIVRDRILPQTDVLLTMHLGEIDTIQLLADGPETRLAVGESLWSYVPQEYDATTSDTVYNAIEVRFRRNAITFSAGGSLTRNAFVVDRDYGGPIGALLARSEKRYGRRGISLDAADLIDDANGGVPASVVTLAELTARLNAFPHRKYFYDCLFSTGLRYQLNDKIYVTDAAEDLNETPSRVVSRTVRAHTVRLGLETEDDLR